MKRRKSKATGLIEHHIENGDVVVFGKGFDGQMRVTVSASRTGLRIYGMRRLVIRPEVSNVIRIEFAED